MSCGSLRGGLACARSSAQVVPRSVAQGRLGSGLFREGRVTRRLRSRASEPVEPVATQGAAPSKLHRCEEVVRHLWENIDLNNSEEALKYFHDDIVYEDLIYAEPFVGKEAVRAFLQSSRDNAPDGLRFVLDDVSDGEDACGFTWHLELDINGEARKITKGISFYRLNPDDRRIIYVTDAPESFIKVGSIGLKLADFAFKASKLFAGKDT